MTEPLPLELLPSCAGCGSYNVRATKIDRIDGLAEYRCADCGEYTVDVWPPTDGAESDGEDDAN